ncbi:ankyrin repeat domain-containing protein [Luteolibacter arcticus]|uniref:Ankyrin repeat domain-containing protein n=1 Tax=Luteolibacter arcticus TaxID=1581411 RepID=A0ABT3GSW3_9BACT|nr:ankyrin repeat domain-containing protein [Luteolibacter arcticus]MCW1926622.1 ankyrin repeat domain-containing protein [Luteolibacter arcticus]
MRRIPIRRAGLLLVSLLLPVFPLAVRAQAQEADLRELLRDALYTEEVTRDAEAAAKQYEALLSQHDAERAFAASALFRLAEVRRKQDRKDEAIALYQKLLARFPEAEVEGKLARDNLTTMGGKPPEPGAADGAREMSPAERRLRVQQDNIVSIEALAETSPDVRKEQLLPAIQSDWPLVVEHLLSKGVDPGMPSALATAARMGRRSICKLLIEKGKPSAEEAGNALAEAIRADRTEILTFLLEEGLDANSPVTGVIDVPVSPLVVAAEEGNLKAATVLLDHGADIDFMIPLSGVPGTSTFVGTALHVAAFAEKGLPMFRLLLERGAKPDLPTPNAGVTPLHVAAAKGLADGVEMVKELLERGADPNRMSTLPVAEPVHSIYEMVTPLGLALYYESAAKIEAMLAKGANLNLHNGEGRTVLSSVVQNKDAKWIETLLRWKADPNVADKNGATPLTIAAHAADEATVRLLLEAGADPNKPSGKRSPLDFAIKQDRGWPIVELLMAKGAKPEAAVFKEAVESKKWDAAMKMLDAGAPLPEAGTDYPWTAPLVVAMQSAEALPLIEKMIAMGAKPEDAWIKSGFGKGHYGGYVDQIPRVVRSFLFRRFVLPQIEGSPAVRVVLHQPGGTKITVLDDPLPPLAPRSLAQSLLEPTQALDVFPKLTPSDRLTIWRKSGEAWTAAVDLPFDSKEDFPSLQRGDVVEITEGPDAANANLRSQSTSGGVFSPDLQWSLRRRVSFPVTVEIDGKAQEVTLRGDRMVFDPSRPEIVPLGGARQVMQYLWQPEIDVTETYVENGRKFIESMEVVIKRDGWPDVRIPYRDSQKDFPLRAGDRIAFTSPKVSEGRLADIRKHGIVVKAANGPFVRKFGRFGGNNTLVPATIPTLLQAVAEVTQRSSMKGAPDDPVALRSWLLHRSGWLFAYVQRPDLSKIRIRRLQEDGTEKILEIDLAKTIADTPEDASIEEVRKADVELQGGDIVEITSLPADKAKPWTGLSLREESFFSKALSCRIQVTDPTGDIRVQEIRFRAPKLVSTDAGLISLPVPEAVSSLNGSASLNSDMNPNVSRDGQPGVNISLRDVFLREGDRITMQSVPLPRPRAVAPTR